MIRGETIGSTSVPLDWVAGHQVLLVSSADSAAQSAAAYESLDSWLGDDANQIPGRRPRDARRHLGSRSESPPRERQRPLFRFASITLGLGLKHIPDVSKLPKLTQRCPLYDPWDPDCPEAPRGVVGRHQRQSSSDPSSEHAMRASLVPDAVPFTAQSAPAATNGHPTSAGGPSKTNGHHHQDQQQQQRQPQDGHSQPSSKQTNQYMAADSTAWMSQQGYQASAPQQGRRRGDQGPQGPGDWLSKLLPKFPGSPSELRNSLPLWLVLSPPGKPDKRRLMTVQDFFQHAEDESMFLLPIDLRPYWRLRTTENDTHSTVHRPTLVKHTSHFHR